MRGFVEVLAAQQTNEATNWYTGTADALRQNLRYIESESPADVLVLSGDQVYRMDFQRLIRAHRETGADVTLAVAPVTRARARALGILRLDDAGRITTLVEKPCTDEALDALMETPAWLDRRAISRDRPFLANMGIYLFKRSALFDLLEAKPADQRSSCNRGILAPALATRIGFTVICSKATGKTSARLRRITRRKPSPWPAHNPPFDFHSPEGVIYTRMRNLPASRIGAAFVSQSLIADGCLVEQNGRQCWPLGSRCPQPRRPRCIVA